MDGKFSAKFTQKPLTKKLFKAETKASKQLRQPALFDPAKSVLLEIQGNSGEAFGSEELQSEIIGFAHKS